VGVTPNDNGLGARVTEVVANSIADRHGVHVGDRICKITNPHDVYCESVHHEDIVRALQGNGALELRLLPDDSPLPQQVMQAQQQAQQPDTFPPKTFSTQIVDLQLAKQNGKLGCEIDTQTLDAPPYEVHVVKGVTQDGGAAVGGLVPGDRVESIEGNAVTGLPHDSVLQLLGANPESSNMRVARFVPVVFTPISKTVVRLPGEALGMTLAQWEDLGPDVYDGCYIASVAEGGPVWRAGDIQPMDVILAINNHGVKDLSNDRITEILRGQGQQLMLTVGRSEMHGPFPGIRRGVRVSKPEGQALGGQLMHTENEVGTMVVAVADNSPLAEAGVVAGDIIYAVNNQDVSRFDDVGVSTVLAQTGAVFTMIVGQHAAPERYTNSATRVFRLKRDAVLGYGLKVITEEDQAGQHHRILSVLPNSPADAIANMLKLGDRIIAVSGVDMTNLPHDALLEALARDEIEIEVVEDHREIVDDDHQLSGVVLFTKSATLPGPGEACGLVLEKRPSAMGVRIAEIQPQSPADYAGFAVGDVMYDINGHPMLRAQLNEVYNAITNSDPIQITVCEPDVIDSIHVVKVDREAGTPLGLSIISDEHGHRVQEVRPASAAAFTRSIFVGDKILYINGIVTADSPHDNVIKMLSHYQTLELVLLTDNADMPEEIDALRLLASSNPALGYKLGPNGVQHVSVIQRRGEVGIRIASFAPKNCGLQVGDVVVDFNGSSVIGLSVAEVKSMMRAGQGEFGTLRHQVVEPLNTAMRAIVFTSDEVKASLGLQLVDVTEDGNGARVLGISPESPANNTELCIGDRLIKINETAVSDIPHGDVLAALKAAANDSDTVTWTVKFDYNGLMPSTSRDGVLDESQVSDVVNGTTREVTVVKGDGGLGLTLMNEEAPIQVYEVAPGSVADQSNQIFPNDIVLEVNGVSTMQATQDDVVALFMQVGPGQPVKLRLQSCESPLFLKQVTLAKANDTFGMQLVESAECVRIGAIKEGSNPASNEPLLAVGDRLVAVNGSRLDAMEGETFDQVLSMFQKFDEVVLLLETDPSPIRRKVTLDRSEGKSLGINVSDYEKDPGVYVLEVNPVGQAFKTGLVMPGDRVVEINGADSSFFSHEEAVTAITSNDEVVLVLQASEVSVPEDAQDEVQSTDDAAATTSFSQPSTVELELTETDASIGIQLSSDTLEDDTYRHHLLMVTEGSLAEKSGLKKGDVITSINGTPLHNVENAVALIAESVGATQSVIFGLN